MSWLDRSGLAPGRRRYCAGLAADRVWLVPAPRRFGRPDGSTGTGGPAAGLSVQVGCAAGALDALAQRLEEVAGATPGRNIDLDVVLDGSHVRWKLVELPPGVARPEEREAIARHQFAGGAAADAIQWQVRAADQPAGWKVPASAVDPQLVDRLGAICRGAGVRLGRVRPYFSAAYDHWRRDIPETGFWFCVVDPGSVGVGLIHEGRWQGLNVRRPSGDWRTQVAAMQAQLAIPAGLDAAGLPGYLVDARMPTDLSSDRAADDSFCRLEPARPTGARLAFGI